MRDIFFLNLAHWRKSDAVWWWLVLTTLVAAGVQCVPIPDANLTPALRTQMVWLMAWAGALFVVPALGAQVAEWQKTSGQIDLWRSVPLRGFEHFLALLSGMMCVSTVFLGIAAMISCCFGVPPGADRIEWIVTNIEAVCLALLALLPGYSIALVAGKRLGATGGFALAVFILLYGLCIVPILGSLRGSLEGASFCIGESLWIIGPHLHFGNLMDRLTFAWGPIPGKVLVNAGAYLVGCAIFAVTACAMIWRK